MSTNEITAPAELDGGTLRRAFGRFATGVTVLTLGGSDPHGMTANSFASVSLEPPLVLLCIGHQAVMHRRLTPGTEFGVSVLGSHQEHLARHFADGSRPRGPAEFEFAQCLPGPTCGVPLISGALAGFECRLRQTHSAGDHTIFVAEVLSVQWQDTAEALLFLGGEFRHAAPHARG